MRFLGVVGAGVGVAVLSLVVGGCRTNPEYAKNEYLKSGDRYFQQKKYAEAIVQYRNALQQDAKFGPARWQLARAYEQLGDIENAYREFIRAADALPDNPEAQVKAGTYLLLARQFEDARGRAANALKKEPRNVEAQILLGNALAGLRNFDAALKELEAAVKLDPGAAGYVSLGAVQSARGNQAEAEAAFRKAVALNPTNPAAHMALANYLWTIGRAADAETSFKQALSIDPKNALAHRALAALYMGNKRAPEAEVHFKALADADNSPAATQKLALADYYVAINRPDDALKVLEQVATGKDAYAAAKTRTAVLDYRRKGSVEGNKVIDEVLTRDPNNVAALLTKAEFLLHEHKLDEALKDAQSASQADPQSVQGHYVLGTIYRARNETDEAIKAFQEVLKLNPAALAAKVQLAQLQLATGAPGPALQFAQDAARALPQDPVVQLTLIDSLLANRDFASADAKMKALLTRFPNNAQVLAMAGKVSGMKGDLKAARRWFEAAQRSDPANGDALNGLVSLDLNERHIDDAKARVDQRLAAAPTDARALVLGAIVYSRAGDLKHTEALLRTAVDADASNLQAYSMLIELYRVQKRLPEARKTLEAVAVRRPHAIGPPTMIGMTYEAEGNFVEARKRYERVLQLDGGAAVAANNLAYLEAQDDRNIDRALQLAQVAKQKLPDAPEVADTLGWIYVRKQLYGLAVSQLTQAVAKQPNNATFQFHLGVALAKAGDATKGRQALERALSLNLEPAAAAEARKLVAKL